jgi:hypothetical protein
MRIAVASIVLKRGDGLNLYAEHTYVCLPSNDSITQKCDRLFTKRTQKIVICVTIQVYLLS